MIPKRLSVYVNKFSGCLSNPALRRRCSTVYLAAGLAGLVLFGCYSGSPVKLALEIPIPSFPPNGASLVPDTLTLNWSSSAWATSFSVEVSTDRNFSALVFSATATSTAQAIFSPLSNNTTYFWRVSSSDGQETSEWSPVFSFTTGVAAPVLIDPEERAVWVPETLTLRWSRPTGAIEYYIQVSTDTGFSNCAVNDTTDSAFFSITSPLTQSTSYYWRVSVLKLQGQSDWSETRTFTIVDSLPAPLLLYPADGAAGVLPADTLRWDTIPSQWASYRVQVSTVSDFSTDVVMDTTLQSSSQTALPLSGLSPSTRYYWRTAARLYLEGFMDRQGTWSAVRSFMTL